MDDFDRAASRLKKDQQKRMESERARKAQELRKAEEARQKIEAIEEAARLKRIEEKAREDALQKQKEEEELLTGGVVFRETYRAVATRHGSDRVCLPPSALHALEFKGAMDQRGAMFFELTTREGGRTHCGVLEFTAEEGTIGLPPKVVTCLGAVTEADETLEGGYCTRVVARYVRLDKGRRVGLRPRTRGFAAAMSAVQGPSVPVYDSERGKWILPGVEGVLHAALQPLCVLTAGDIVTVTPRSGGGGGGGGPMAVDGAGEGAGEGERESFDLEVAELEPETSGGGVSLIDTDIEVVFLPARADLEEMERMEAAGRAAAARREAWAVLLAAAAARDVARAGGGGGGEPADGASVTVAVRLPSGGRITRRFARGDGLDALYDWAAVAGLGPHWAPPPAPPAPADPPAAVPRAADPAAAAAAGWADFFLLAMPYPRRVLAPPPPDAAAGGAAAGGTLEGAGLAGPMEALVLEEAR